MARRKYSKSTRAERERASRGSAEDVDKPFSLRAVELAFGGLLGLAFATVVLIFFGDWLIPRDSGEADTPEAVKEETVQEEAMMLRALVYAASFRSFLYRS